MIKKYDVVEANVDLNEKVYKGCRGTVLMIYPDFPTSFEVEFIDKSFNTLDVLTVLSDDIKKIIIDS